MKRTLIIATIALVSLGLGYFIWTVKNSVDEKFAVIDNITSTPDSSSATISKDTAENKAIASAEQACSYENATSDLGIGIMIAPTTFEIFEDASLTKKRSTINMYEDEGKINFCSMFFKPDYGIMHFACLENGKNSYKVLTGFSDQKFLPKQKGYEFKTWEKYILESFGVRRKLEITPMQSLKESPNENSKDLEIPDEHELFCPMALKGDWIQVKYDCFYNLESNEHEGEPCHNYIDKCDKPLTGWIKWKNKNDLLIDIFLMP
jgi:hypothetical protein